jgi:FixJ family two-component response regulator
MAMPPLVAVIDDDAAVANAVCSLLRSLGLRAAPYPSAEAFLAAADLDLVSCVLTDLSMPGMGGIGLKRAIDARGPGLPVIIMTGRSEPALLASAAAECPEALIIKPVDPAELCACVREAIARRPPGR